MTEANPCPTCGYQIDRVERINNENAQLSAKVVRLTGYNEGLVTIGRQKNSEIERLRAALERIVRCDEAPTVARNTLNDGTRPMPQPNDQ